MKRIIPALLLCAVLLLSGCKTFGVMSFETYDGSGGYTAAVGTVKLEGVTSINIDWVYGSVRIEESDVSAVTFSEVSTADGKTDALGQIQKDSELTESLRMRYILSDGELTVKYCKSGLRVRYGAVADLKKDLTVYVPSGTSLERVTVNSVSSDIYMYGIEADTADVNGVSSAGIKIVDCKIKDLSAYAVSGNIELDCKETPEKTDVGAVSGQIKLSLPSVTDLKCSATAGDVTLELESADFSLTATGIHPLSVTGFEYSEKDSVYTFGSGSGSAEINCISGKVRIVSK